VHGTRTVPDAFDDATPAAVRRLYDLINASWTTQAVYAAALLRIPDLLSDGPRSAESLAGATGCDPQALARLLRALASLDLCRECGDAFELTPLGALLRADAPASLRAWAIHSGRYLWPAWGRLAESVGTGASDRKRATGADDFGSLERDPEAAAVFNRAMVEVTRLVARDVARRADLAGVASIVDVGGGYGKLIAAILEAHPRMRGVLFDLPHAIVAAGQQLAAAGVAARCELVAGSFFESVPEGADAYALKSVLHNWDDDRSAAILRNCRRAAHGRSRLLVVERVMSDRVSPVPRDQAIARADLNMLIARSGRERTEAEFRALLERAGFRIERIQPAVLEFSVIEASPA
jgi:ubiquinone/menaquinone biosynthesis C-methylase UbiE